jgi:hypothetical protein
MSSGGIAWTDVPNSTLTNVWHKATVMRTTCFYSTDSRPEELPLPLLALGRISPRMPTSFGIIQEETGQIQQNMSWELPARAAQSPIQLQQTEDLLVLSAYHTKLDDPVLSTLGQDADQKSLELFKR